MGNIDLDRLRNELDKRTDWKATQAVFDRVEVSPARGGHTGWVGASSTDRSITDPTASRSVSGPWGRGEPGLMRPIAATGAKEIRFFPVDIMGEDLEDTIEVLVTRFQYMLYITLRGSPRER